MGGGGPYWSGWRADRAAAVSRARIEHLARWAAYLLAYLFGVCIRFARWYAGSCEERRRRRTAAGRKRNADRVAGFTHPNENDAHGGAGTGAVEERDEWTQ